MIRRSENGPICTHCGGRNPASILKPDTAIVACIHCEREFEFWIEKLPFYCTDDGRAPRCDCDVCRGKTVPTEEVEPDHG